MRPRQLSFFPAASAISKNCVRCLKDFGDFSPFGRAKVCPACRKPKSSRPRWKELKELNGRPFTPRENQIAEMVADGRYNKEIAWDCKLTEGTIKVYVTTIYAKAGVRSRVPFVKWWLKQNNKLVA